MNKNTKIGLGVLAVIGIGYYLWKKSNKTIVEKKSNIWGNDYYGDKRQKWRGRKNVPVNS